MVTFSITVLLKQIPHNVRGLESSEFGVSLEKENSSLGNENDSTEKKTLERVVSSLGFIFLWILVKIPEIFRRERSGVPWSSTLIFCSTSIGINARLSDNCVSGSCSDS